ncbi:MAG: glycosyltransferase [Flavobacteriaceae bacterium]|nr:glycosyltransferase [Flavobacteriaceae bacterium]
MKILQVNKFLKPVGGAETYMFSLANALKELDHEVEFWGMYDEDNSVDDTYNTFVRNIKLNGKKPMVNYINEAFNLIYSFKNKNKFKKIISLFQPDVIHVHNFNYQLTPSFLSEANKAGIRVIHTIHDSQLVCPNHQLYIPHKNEICYKCIGGKYQNAVYNKCIKKSYAKSALGMLESYIHHNILNTYNKYFNTLISPSNFYKKIVQTNIKKEIIRQPNFIHFDNPVQQERDNYVLYFGRISSEKGVERLLKIFKKLDYKLILVGKGDIKIESNNNIEYLGPKYGQELISLIKKAKFTIHPSIWHDNFPMSILESLAQGTPVIASNHSGFLETINKTNGYLLDFDGVNIVEKMNTILSTNDYLDVNRIALDARKKYGKDDHVKEIINIYKRS